MTKQILTQSQLKKALHYNPDTGVFTWRKCYFRNKEGTVAGYVCNTHGYRFIRINRVKYRAAPLAHLYMTGNLPAHIIDHMNHVCDDDSWANLRHVTEQENFKNQSLPSNNETGIIGVYWNKAMCKYHAQIRVHRKRIHLGFYDSLGCAAASRKAAENKYGFHKNHGV